jgi:diacylglycerol kinase (ATP)
MDKRDFFAVISKQAGNYHKDIVREISETFLKQGLTVKFYTLEGNAQVKQEIAKAQNQGYYSFLAIGGDGTVNLMASTLYGKPHRLGIIPAGTTNALARVLDIPLAIGEAIKLSASSNKVKPVDGLQIQDRILIMNVSVGLSSAALRNLNSKEKSRFGVLAYLLGIIRNFGQIKAHNYQIQVNDSLYNIRAIELHVTNTGIIGTPRFQIYRNSRIDDGEAEVLIFRHWSIKEIFNAILDIMINRKGQAIKLIAAGNDILIKSNVPMAVQGDGDIIQETPVRIKVLPQVINFIVS